MNTFTKPQEECLERLRKAYSAIAALIVHDSLPYHKVFVSLETEIARREDPTLNATLAKAQKVIQQMNGRVSTKDPDIGTIAPPPPESPPVHHYSGKMFNTKDAAEYLGYSISWLYVDRSNANRKGGYTLKIPFRKVGKEILYRKVDLDEFKKVQRAERQAVKAEQLQQAREAANAAEVSLVETVIADSKDAPSFPPANVNGAHPLAHA